MALSPGARLGPFAILAPLGAGGMGEVYRARDTRLDREVAIKVPPDTFADDPERAARFDREARALAALNHPHIAQLHGLEESSGVSALVMELVDGEDLADRIARGPVPLDMAQQPAHLQIELPAGVHLAIDTDHPVLALSPDGATLVFVGDENGTRRLYLRRLAEREARPIPGTEGAASPFFSPDGARVGFYAGWRFSKVALAGGVPIPILVTNSASVGQGATWLDGDRVAFAASVNSGLSRAPMSGDQLHPRARPGVVDAGRMAITADSHEHHRESAERDASTLLRCVDLPVAARGRSVDPEPARWLGAKRWRHYLHAVTARVVRQIQVPPPNGLQRTRHGNAASLAAGPSVMRRTVRTESAVRNRPLFHGRRSHAELSRKRSARDRRTLESLVNQLQCPGPRGAAGVLPT